VSILDHVHRFSDKISPASPRQLDALEREMRTPLPLGYREFMTDLGDGWYCDMIDVLMPDKVIGATKGCKPQLAECFAELAPEHRATLSRDDASRGFVFGYMNPDGPYRSELWHVPGAAHPLYVLTPFHTDIYWVENGFQDPLNWMSVNGTCAENRRMTLALDRWDPLPVTSTRRRIVELIPDCVTKFERTDPSGRLATWIAWSTAIGGRVTVSSHIQEFDDVVATRVDTDREANTNNESAGGVDVTIDYDRDTGAHLVDAAVTVLGAEGFELRYKRIR
jgi:hypothetical protein